MSWGFSSSDGKTKAPGESTWKFYNSSGELQTTLTGSSSSADSGYLKHFLLMGA
jgi:hypothetical protein